MKARDPSVVGIDVSKTTLVVSSYGEGKKARARQTVAQNEEAVARLIKSLGRDSVSLVAVESTGGYELPLLTGLHAAGIKVARLPPEQVKAFARSQRKRAKTDAIDCEIIADYAAVTDVELWSPMCPQLDEALAMLKHRDTLIRERTREKNRLEHAVVPIVRESISRHVTELSRSAKAMEKAAVARIQTEPKASALFKLLLTVPGVGILTAGRLVVELPELAHIGKRQVSSLAGLAPMNRDSGEVEGRRRCAPGRTRVRTALFQAAHSAVSCNPAISAFYVRLRQRGKDRKVALTACAHKLLVILSSMARNNERWDESRHPGAPVALPPEEVAALNDEAAALGFDPTSEPEPAQVPTSTASPDNPRAPKVSKPATAPKRRHVTSSAEAYRRQPS